MINTKQETTVRQITQICALKKIDHAVISSGSRNAPLIIGFSEQDKIKCLSIKDERSAGYFALGIAKQTKNTVIICCTSGTAVLNLAPSIAEAYYQKIPLLIITADRPAEWIDQRDGQTIRQNSIFQNYILKNFSLPIDVSHPDEAWFVNRIVNEAINFTRFPSTGPVHLNVPLREPLYNKNLSTFSRPNRIIDNLPPKFTLSQNQISDLSKTWNKCRKKMIICGMMPFSNELLSILNKAADDPSTVILTDTLSNLKSNKFFSNLETIISTMNHNSLSQYSPDILITLGLDITSKKLKSFLRSNKPYEHWHISTDGIFPDTYQCITKNIPLQPTYILKKLKQYATPAVSSYQKKFQKIAKQISLKHKSFMKEIKFCDFMVYNKIIQAIPKNSSIHLGNSTPVRYFQLFDIKNTYAFNSNRGTNGIDGCLSTAIGASYALKKLTTVILGDISFFYDINGLWNNHIHPFLRIIIINNGGGNIFRLIDGPDKHPDVMNFLETPQNLSARLIAKQYNLGYSYANNDIDLESALTYFYSSKNNKASILEIETPPKYSAKTYKNYFKHMKG